jgi:hypothetical protein
MRRAVGRSGHELATLRTSRRMLKEKALETAAIDVNQLGSKAFSNASMRLASWRCSLG